MTTAGGRAGASPCAGSVRADESDGQHVGRAEPRARLRREQPVGEHGEIVAARQG